MSQESILSYENNSLILKYKELFMQKLYNIFLDLRISDIHKKKFLELDTDSQQKFLFFSDISSLILRIQSTDSQEYLDLLTQELIYYLDDCDFWAHYQWEYIAWTTIRLTMEDNNPDNNIISAPSQNQETVLWWWEKTQEEWNQVLSRAFQIIQSINYGFFIEIQDMVQKIVPMKTSRGIHHSCTYRDCIWTLYIWYTIDAEFPEFHIIEALIHESSHNKLNLILQSEELYENNTGDLYYSPYRPDARPLHGVFIGVHALVPSIYILLQAIEKEIITDTKWKQKILLYHIKNKLWYNVVKKFLQPTTLWSIMVSDIEIVMKKCDELIHSLHLVQELDIAEIQKRAKKHFIDVKNSYPMVKY